MTSIEKKSHQISEHAPILFPWTTDFRAHGIDRSPSAEDMKMAGWLLRAAREECAPCMQRAADHLARTEDGAPVLHLVGSAWTRLWAAGADPAAAFGPDSMVLVAPMLREDMALVLDLADRLPAPRRYAALDDAVAVLAADRAELVELARDHPISGGPRAAAGPGRAESRTPAAVGS
jgi:hypothetical protein